MHPYFWPTIDLLCLYKFVCIFQYFIGMESYKYTFCLASFIWRFIHVVYISCLFLVISEQYSTIWIYQNQFMHSSIKGHLGCFQFGIITNKVAINVHLCGHTLSLLLGRQLGLEQLGHKICAYLPLKKKPQQCIKFQLLHIFTNTQYSLYFSFQLLYYMQVVFYNFNLYFLNS